MLVCWAASSEVSFAEDKAKLPPRLTSEQYHIQARIAQLRAEAKDMSEISFSTELTTAASTDPALASLLDETQKRFELHKEERQQKQAELRSRILSAKTSIEEQQQQLTANRNRLAMVSGKLESLKPAVEKGLIGENYVSGLTSEVEQLRAQSNGIEENIAQIKWSVAEYSLELSAQESDRLKTVQAELKSLEMRKRQAEKFEEEMLASETSNQRLGYSAPDAQSYSHSSME